jgi:hypothetical protein
LHLDGRAGQIAIAGGGYSIELGVEERGDFLRIGRVAGGAGFVRAAELLEDLVRQAAECPAVQFGRRVVDRFNASDMA